MYPESRVLTLHPNVCVCGGEGGDKRHNKKHIGRNIKNVSKKIVSLGEQIRKGKQNLNNPSNLNEFDFMWFYHKYGLRLEEKIQQIIQNHRETTW